MDKSKEVLTTGEVARICNVAPRTVSKWFDSGQLRGYRIPGSKDRRIPISYLVRFMRAHGMPLNGLDSGRVRVVLVDTDEQFARAVQQALGGSGYEVSTAATAFEAGVLAERIRPHVMLVDLATPDLSPAALVRHVRAHEAISAIKLVAVGGGLSEGQEHALRQAGFEACLRKPFDMQKLVRTIEDALAVPS
ncbi:MAG TPA: response regulator [Phycisphaerae bacterium]|jgi:excisionase family DNA binding protein